MAISTNRERRRFLLRLGLFLPLIVGCEEALIIPGGTEVVSVLLNPPSFPMAVGEVMRPDVLPRNAEGRVIVGGPVFWASSDSSVASVDSLGLVRAPTSLRRYTIEDACTPPSATGRLRNSRVCMQPETLNRSIQPTPTVHPRGFTPRPVQLSMAVDIGAPVGSRVSVGDNHSCAVGTAGLFCWGANDRVQLGSATLLESPLPVRVSIPSLASDVATGAAHACAVTVDRQVVCWGDNRAVQLGQTGPGSIGTGAPVPLPGLFFEAVGAGGSQSCAASRGEVWCWGEAIDPMLGPVATIPPQSTRSHRTDLSFERRSPTRLRDSAESLRLLGRRNERATRAGTRRLALGFRQPPSSHGQGEVGFPQEVPGHTVEADEAAILAPA